MPRTRSLLLALLAASVAAPLASAKECPLGNADLCSLAKDAKFDVMFGEFADVGLLFAALLGTAFLLVLLVWLVRLATRGALVRLQASEKVRELEPGGSATFRIELENPQKNRPVEIFLERSGLPEGWASAVTAKVELPSGFRQPITIGDSTSLLLSSRRKGGHRALLEIRLTAPPQTRADETVEYEFRALPVSRGAPRKRSSKRVLLTALVTAHLPVVEITRVEHDPARIRPGAAVVTRAHLVNKGEKEAHDVRVSFTLNGAEVDKKVVPELAVQAETDVEFNWTPQAGENKIRVAIAS